MQFGTAAADFGWYLSRRLRVEVEIATDPSVERVGVYIAASQEGFWFPFDAAAFWFPDPIETFCNPR